jgi:hypothetical protein
MEIKNIDTTGLSLSWLQGYSEVASHMQDLEYLRGVAAALEVYEADQNALCKIILKEKTKFYEQKVKEITTKQKGVMKT